MAWQLHDLLESGKPVQLMLEDRFRNDLPGAELPRLVRLRVNFIQPAEDYYWHPDESAKIDDIEDQLLQLADQHGEGWVVFVQRRAEAGCLDFYFYVGSEAKIEQVIPDLKTVHPEYRIDFEESSDPSWSAYLGWFDAAAKAQVNPNYTPTPDTRLN